MTRTGEQTDHEREFLVQLGERIRQARRAAGHTQYELAAMVDLTRSSIANIETGRQALSAWSLVRLAALLRIEAPGVPTEPATLVDDEKRRRLTEDNAQLRRRLNAIRSLVVDATPDLSRGLSRVGDLKMDPAAAATDDDWQPGDPVYPDQAPQERRHCGPCLMSWTAEVECCPECGQLSTEALRRRLNLATPADLS